MMTVRRHEVRGAGITMGRTIIAPSRSLEPLDVADPGAVQIGAQPLYRSADAQMDAIQEAAKQTAIERAKAEAAAKVADKTAPDAPTYSGPVRAARQALDSPLAVLIALGIVAWLVLRK